MEALRDELHQLQGRNTELKLGLDAHDCNARDETDDECSAERRFASLGGFIQHSLDVPQRNIDAVHGPSVKSAPVSKGASPTMGKSATVSGTESPEPRGCTLQLVQTALQAKNKEISQLRAQLDQLKPRFDLLTCRNGQLEIGLGFYHITSRLEIHLFGARNLRAVNLNGRDSDPYAKVRVFKNGSSEGKLPRWKFHTAVVWKTLSPEWNEK